MRAWYLPPLRKITKRPSSSRSTLSIAKHTGYALGAHACDSIAFRLHREQPEANTLKMQLYDNAVAVLELLMPKKEPCKMDAKQGQQTSMQVLHRSGY